MYSYCPNAPTCLRNLPPTVKGKADMQTLLDTLLDKENAALLAAMTNLLSQYSKD